MFNKYRIKYFDVISSSQNEDKLLYNDIHRNCTFGVYCDQRHKVSLKWFTPVIKHTKVFCTVVKYKQGIPIQIRISIEVYESVIT